jgi:hypothetical protein
LTAISLLGIPHDDNSSFMKGASEAPPHIRRELLSDCYSSWSETGIDVCAAADNSDYAVQVSLQLFVRVVVVDPAVEVHMFCAPLHPILYSSIFSFIQREGI